MSDALWEKFSNTKEKTGLSEACIDYDFLDVGSFKILTEAKQNEFFAYMLNLSSNENLIPLDTAMKWIEEYLWFLVLSNHAQGFVPIPSEAVDKIWNIHMQHTKQYWEWCKKYLGKVLPHFAMRGDEEGVKLLVKDYTQTLSLYRKVFSVYPNQ